MLRLGVGSQLARERFNWGRLGFVPRRCSGLSCVHGTPYSIHVEQLWLLELVVEVDSAAGPGRHLMAL
jgi:hypothetical protein